MTPKQVQGIIEQEMIRTIDQCGACPDRAQAIASLVNEWICLYEIGADQEEDK